MKNKEEKIKNKLDKKVLFAKAMAFVLLSLMIIASCSTCIYYVVKSF